MALHVRSGLDLKCGSDPQQGQITNWAKQATALTGN